MAERPPSATVRARIDGCAHPLTPFTGIGYRLSPLTLGRLDDMLEISLAVPPPASTTPAPVSATSPLMNGTPAAKSSAAPSPTKPASAESTPTPQSLAVPDVEPYPMSTTSATSVSVPAPIASPPAVDGAPKSSQPSVSQSTPANPINAVPSISSAQSVKTSATAVAASTNASDPMDIDAAPKPKALNAVSTTNRVGSNPPGVNPAPEKMLVYPEASGSFIVPKPRTAAVPIVPPGTMPPQ
jgi:hypothetical protein